METAWWWSKDAATHKDRTRCGRCGHADAFHAHGAAGKNAGRCTAKNCEGGACPCRSFLFWKDR